MMNHISIQEDKNSYFADPDNNFNEELLNLFITSMEK